MNIPDLDIDKLSKQIDEWALDVFGETFKFRPHQKETVMQVIQHWAGDIPNVIMEAPTGTGKSIIAMCVAGVLSRYYDKTGYILISDLSLLKQYENDITMYLPHWGYIRGQSTYRCIKNGFNFATGVCKIRGCKSYGEIKSKFPDCAPYCEYIVQREKAINAPVTVCTYVYWLLQRNLLSFKDDDGAPFPQRDFVICDEAHKLVEIVQNNFSPRLGKEDIAKVESLNLLLNLHSESIIDRMQEIKNRLATMPPGHNGEVFDCIKDYGGYLNVLSKRVGDALLDVRAITLSKDDKKGKKEDDKINNKIATLNLWLNDYAMRIGAYRDIIERIGPDNIVSTVDNNGSITLKCLNDNYLMASRFHCRCGDRMYMSATIGDPAVYATNINVREFRSIKLPCVFDYTKSPIYFVNEYKMSYTAKDASFPMIALMIDGIMNLYRGMRGIIQTGNYKFAQDLQNVLSPQNKERLLIYNDSMTKKDCLDALRYSDDKVLVGPSLVEGLSLNDDLCRFQIMMKVPYPSTADNYVKAKMERSQSWYDATTCVSILQGVGRGIRSEQDWCVTFILDACFNNLYWKASNMFPPEFVQRLQCIPSSSIIPYAGPLPKN